MDPLHLREVLEDRVPHLNHVDVRDQVEDSGGEALQQLRGPALAAAGREQGLGAHGVRRRRRREREVRERLRCLFTEQERGARGPPGGPGGEPPRRGGGERR